MIYAVDFDGTLSFGKWPETGSPNGSLFDFLIGQKDQGARIILNTCRTGDQLTAAVEYCRNYGLEFDAVNENLPELVEWYGSDCRKINADRYIDDKSVTPEQLLTIFWGVEAQRRKGSDENVIQQQ